ncbi:hypothetical protein WS81_29290 [Burkholderia sp. MSMB2040]|nr:hypothetical protein WS81_29290 [Burkholderia sp. MSMB2040]
MTFARKAGAARFAADYGDGRGPRAAQGPNDIRFWGGSKAPPGRAKAGREARIARRAMQGCVRASIGARGEVVDRGAVVRGVAPRGSRRLIDPPAA